MQDRGNKASAVDHVEERSLTSDFLTGAATTAGGLTAIKGSKVLGKLVDAVKPKSKS